MGCNNSSQSGDSQNGAPAVVQTKSLDETFQLMRKGVSLQDRKWMGQTYKQCLDAKEVVSWLVAQSLCGTREAAVKVGLDLQEQGLIVHVWGSKKVKFADHGVFFRYAGAEVEKGEVQAADVYDLVVIGAGVAGIAAASWSTSMGANVLCIEAKRIGGDCTWSGCVPSKALIKTSHIVHSAKEAQKFGVGVSKPEADLKPVKDYVWDKIHTVAKLDDETMENTGVPMRFAAAKFLDANTVELKDKETSEISKVRGRSFILCVGAEPAPPPIKGLDDVKYYTYETIFDVDVLPKRMCVVGGGVIGCEMAQAFARLGAKVTLVANQILPKEPPKVDEFLSAQFEEDGIERARGRAEAVEKTGNGDELRLTVKGKTDSQQVVCDLLLVASGRRPHTMHMNLEAAGVEVDAKTRLIKVNEQLQTTAEHIYAAGDCCTLQQFTHYAGIMGFWAARNLLLPGSGVPTHVIPRVTFTSPEVASVGMNEEEARKALGKDFRIASMPNTHNERAVCENDLRGFSDIYLDKKGHIVGATLMCNRAGELLTELLVAMENKIPFANLSWVNVIHPYPTYSFSMMILAGDVLREDFDKSLPGKMSKWLVARS